MKRLGATILTLTVLTTGCSGLTDAEEWCLEPYWVNGLPIDEAARTLDLATPRDFYVEQGGALDETGYPVRSDWWPEIWPAYIESDDGNKACHAAFDEVGATWRKTAGN